MYSREKKVCLRIFFASITYFCAQKCRIQGKNRDFLEGSFRDFIFFRRSDPDKNHRLLDNKNYFEGRGDYNPICDFFIRKKCFGIFKTVTALTGMLSAYAEEKKICE